MDWNATNTTDTGSCEQVQDAILPLFLHFGVVIALVLLIVLSFLTKRTNRCMKCCWGRPAIVVPLNLLDSFEDRWAYACAYGAISNVILNFFFNGGGLFPSNSIWLKVFTSLLGALEISIVFSPFFACLNTDSTIISPLIGFLYSLLWLVLSFVYTAVCLDPIPTAIPFAGLITQLPGFICMIGVVVNFLRLTVLGFMGLCRKKEGEESAASQLVSTSQWKYVMALLARPMLPSTDQLEQQTRGKRLISGAKGIIHRKVLLNKDHFLYSTRIICTMVVTGMSLFQVFIIVYAFRNVLVQLLTPIVIAFELNHLLDIIEVLFHLIAWVSLLAVIVQMYMSLRNYRKHTLKLYRGDRSFIFKSYQTSNTNRLRTSLLFSGYQVAFTIWCFIIIFGLLAVIGIVVTFMVIIPIVAGNWEFIWSWTQGIIVPLLVSVLLRVAQTLLATFVFLQDKINKTDPDRPLAITNRRLYHIFNYFFFLANIAIGLFSCLLRILFGTFGGLFFLGRLDRSVLMKGLERMDAGHMAYLGILITEHAHNHPVLRVFCAQLLATMADRKRKYLEMNNVNTIETGSGVICLQVKSIGEMEASAATVTGIEAEPHMNRRARNRWHLAYTLINNPELVQFRVSTNGSGKQHERTLLVGLAKQKLLAQIERKCEPLGQSTGKIEFDMDKLVEQHAQEICNGLNLDERYSRGKEKGVGNFDPEVNGAYDEHEKGAEMAAVV